MSAPRPEGIASTPGAPYPKLIGRLALTCMAAAVLSGAILGTWELAHLIVGLLGLAIFGLFPPGIALIIEGAVWMAFGYVVYRSRRAPNLLVAHHRAFMMTGL